jgi:hypothetical protein
VLDPVVGKGEAEHGKEPEDQRMLIRGITDNAVDSGLGARRIQVIRVMTSDGLHLAPDLQQRVNEGKGGDANDDDPVQDRRGQPFPWRRDGRIAASRWSDTAARAARSPVSRLGVPRLPLS